MELFPLASKIDSLWNKCLMATLSSSPVFLARMEPSFRISCTVLSCRAPMESNGSGTKQHPSLAHFSPYFVHLVRKAWPMANLGSSAHLWRISRLTAFMTNVHQGILPCSIGRNNYVLRTRLVPKNGPFFLPWGKIGGLSCLEDSVTEEIMPGNSFARHTTWEGVVTINITSWVSTCCTGSFLRKNICL